MPSRLGATQCALLSEFDTKNIPGYALCVVYKKHYGSTHKAKFVGRDAAGLGTPPKLDFGD